MIIWLKSILLAIAARLVDDYMDDAIPYIANNVADHFSTLSNGVISRQAAADLIVDELNRLQYDLSDRLKK